MAFKLVSILLPFVIGLVGLAVELHIAASRHFTVMCSALQRSRGLHEELRNSGAFTMKFRLMTVSAMAAGMVWPVLAIRQGWLDPEDYRLFPGALKRRMKVGMYCIFIGMTGIAFVACLVEFK
ncbi:hypothetical protein P0Y43_02960 [Pseudomonas entomophila]|uniref:hypothetical protein n=1 Tax=Pseudomonas entomophila TaxID=312306 RepID=UPI0023D885FD|nr:hypothetical protein [Pseudomonas entomophila]MDF0729689.1 hypothetical protein [Pseudomonas entomophila]